MKTYSILFLKFAIASFLCFPSFSNTFCQKYNDKKNDKKIQKYLSELVNCKTVNAKTLILRDIAEMHEKANSAGNSILPYLSNENWELKIASAITLGYIKYLPANESLLKTLNFEPDCRLNFVSAIALGKLKSHSSLQQLKLTKENHWNPMVRKAASDAILQIEDTTYNLKTKNYSSFGEEFFSYESDAMWYPCCKLDSCSDTKELSVPNGILVCTNNGEFGGNLKLTKNDKSESIITQGNFHSIYKIDNYIITINGLAHLGFNSGSINQVKIESDGSYSIIRIMALPGAPIVSKKDNNGNIIINTYGGTVSLTKDLKLKTLKCDPQ